MQMGSMMFWIILLTVISFSHQFDELSKDIADNTEGDCEKVNGVWTEWISMDSISMSETEARYRMCYKDGSIVEIDRKVKRCTGRWNVVAPCCKEKPGGLMVEEHKCNSSPLADDLRIRYCNGTDQSTNNSNNGTTNIKNQTGEKTSTDKSFAIQFRDTSSNIPIVRNVSFPASDGISICFWFNVTEFVYGRAVVSYITREISTRNDLVVWFSETNFFISVKQAEVEVLLDDYHLNSWTHFCWTWRSTGEWLAYINGTLAKKGISYRSEFRERFPKTKGFVALGQDTDSLYSDFIGKITELYIYNSTLTEEEVMHTYNHQPPKENAVIRWKQFKGRAYGREIVEIPSPFSS